MRTAILILALAVTAAAGDADELLARLGSPDYQSRRKAVLAAEGRAEPEILDRLLDMARSDPHPNIRGYAAKALATSDDPRVFPLLRAMAVSESYPGPRQAALVALGRRGDPRAFDLLVSVLTPPNGDAGHAAKALGLLGDPRAFDALAKLLGDGAEDPYIAELGPEALVRVDGRRGVALLLERFAKLPPGARGAAATAIAEHAPESAAGALLPHLASDDRDLRLAAIRALGGVGGTAARDALVAHLEGRAADAATTARALEEIGDAAAAPALATALGSATDPATRMTIMATLARLGDRRAVAAIAPFLDDDTFLPQPETMSRVATFPLNTRVSHAAWWALRTLRDGSPPVGLGDLAGFMAPPPAAEEIATDLPAVRRWWVDRRDDPRFRF